MTDLRLADDIILFALSRLQCTDMLRSMVDALRSVGLVLNVKKTTCLTTEEQPPDLIRLDIDTCIEVVRTCHKWLGCCQTGSLPRALCACRSSVRCFPEAPTWQRGTRPCQVHPPCALVATSRSISCRGGNAPLPMPVMARDAPCCFVTSLSCAAALTGRAAFCSGFHTPADQRGRHHSFVVGPGSPSSISSLARACHITGLPGSRSSGCYGLVATWLCPPEFGCANGRFPAFATAYRCGTALSSQSMPP